LLFRGEIFYEKNVSLFGIYEKLEREERVDPEISTDIPDENS